MTLTARKPARRRSEVPADVRRALSSGELESANLIEWLIVDQVALLGTLLEQLELDAHARRVLAAARPLKRKGVMQRVTGIGALLHALTESLSLRERLRVRKAILAHRSDMVRAWGACLLCAEKHVALPERLAKMRPLAADAHFGVREIAWAALRPHVAHELDRALRLLEAWARDRDPNIRRFASEVTRPRGVWCEHIAVLKKDPGRAAELLEHLRSDPSRYVRDSVGNWLNDAAKSRPDWVKTLTRRWLAESQTQATKAIVKRATRGLRDRAGEKSRETS
ncbi:MAG: DNA alkylation repair protein [Planctomycetota bacterium]|nr:MAG: DNA alkylation repair protein [Planctomycetota bacterium]